MIREATANDVPRIVELGSRSLVDGPYKDQIRDNPEQSAAYALSIINGAGKVLVYEKDGIVHGLLGFLVCPHYFTGEITASELMWYVEPEHRVAENGYFPALELLKASEDLAAELGAVKMSFSAPTEQVGDLYKRFGYRKVEVSYQKELQCQLSPR